MIRIGMVGSGFAARIHLDAYRQIGMQDAALTGICSKDADLHQVAEHWNIPYVYEDLDQMLADPEIDAVDIITPPALHEVMLSPLAWSTSPKAAFQPLWWTPSSSPSRRMPEVVKYLLKAFRVLTPPLPFVPTVDQESAVLTFKTSPTLAR